MTATTRADSAIGFRLMTLMYRVRDLLQDPRSILEAAHLEQGMNVADYGCGPGSFAVAAAEIVGEGGKVHAIDVNPLAIASVRQRAAKKGLGNLEAILVRGYDTGIEASSVNRVLLIDTIHGIEDTDALFHEIRRILKPDGLLFMHKGHMPMPEQRELVDGSGLFEIVESHGLTILAAPPFLKKQDTG
jgi:ubiquinone/menaquinone biosynthesis C-methylase UbiE